MNEIEGKIGYKFSTDFWIPKLHMTGVPKISHYIL